MIIDIVKVFLPAVIAFIIGILITPPLTDFLYKHKMWKKKSGKVDMRGQDTPIFNELHKEKQINTPRMGGVVVWASVFITISAIWFLAEFVSGPTLINLDILSRSQTWIPLATLILGGLIGLLDDYLVTRPTEGQYEAAGIPLKKRLIVVFVLALLCSLWFYFKLDVNSIGLPEALGGFVYLGTFFIPFFILVIIALYAGGVIDGIDGLSGGVFAAMFGAYGGIAFYQEQFDLAAFCATVVGGILAFLWFNIPPARYYMSDTGMMGLTITLGIVAFMTDRLGEGYGILVLPVIALPLVVTIASNIIQVLSKRFRGKKVFLVAPLHHHFEAIGWPAYKVTMRYWVISLMCAVLGITLALIG